MLPYRDSRITKFALVIFFLLVIAYAYFEVQGILFGPKINIVSTLTIVTDPYITIRGTADHIATLTMNGEPISVTEQGAFEQPFVLAPGDNHIFFDAKDKYGRVSQRDVEIMYYQSITGTSSSSSAVSTKLTG